MNVLEVIALLVFVFIYILIIGRTKFNIPIWASMVIGAVLMLITQTISLTDAMKSINLQVIGFLFGMFSIISALERSGILRHLALWMLTKAKTPRAILAVFVIGMGVLSAFLVNDTIALVGVPLIIYISKHMALKPKPLLISLAFGISIGSIMTPIGNPQNLLISLQSGIRTPFITFLSILGIPTIICLIITTLLLQFYYKKQLSPILLASTSITDYCGMTETKTTTLIPKSRLAKISLFILIFIFAGFIVSEALRSFHVANIDISVIALAGAIILYSVSSERKEIFKSVDYRTLMFFVAMFIVTSALWYSNLVPTLMSFIPKPDSSNIIQSNMIISVTSITLSQLLSNVPFVALYNFVMIDNGFDSSYTSQWMMLAAASTIAGNLTILGAASNIIIIQAAESRGIKSFTYMEFFKVGLLVTLVNTLVFYVYITFI